MKLILHENGEEKIYHTPFVSARRHRKLMEFDESIDYTDLNVEEIDLLAGFVCDVFGNQFDVNTFYDGVAAHKLIDTIIDVFVYVRTGKEPEEVKKTTGNDQGK